MLAFFTDSAYDAFWHLFLEFDLSERVQARGRQKMLLARYARIPPSYWEGRPVTAIEQAVRDLSAVVNEETADVEDL